MMTQEQAKTAIAKCTAKIDFFEGLTARLVDMIDEIETARHDNVLWQFGEDWTLAENVAEGWDATETAREGLGRLRWLCDDQLTRERNKVKVLEAYVTRLDGEAIPTEVTATDTDPAEREFDETHVNFVDGEDRLNYLSELEPFKAEFKAALRGVYLDTDGYSDVQILPAVDWAELIAPMYVSDHSTTAYRKNADGTFTEDADAYKRIREVELKMVKFGNPELEDTQADNAQVDELNAILQTKTCGATWHVHTRLQGDRGYRSLILSDMTVKADRYTGRGYDFINRCEVLAHYDTAAQVAKVIGRIGAVVIFKDRAFNFPHVAELTATDYGEKHWAVDFGIYHSDSDLTEEELRTCTDRLSDALSANDTRVHVELEDCVITVYGDSGGDNDTVDKIIGEMCKRGCWVEYPEDAEDDATK